MVTAIFWEGVADPESIPFKFFECDLEWLTTVGVDEHLKPSRPEWLDAGN
jgi:hypothetical protein